MNVPSPPNLGDLPPHPDARPSAREAARSLAGGLLVVALLLLLLALSFTNVTAEGPAKRGLRQSVAILTEVDAYLDEHWESFRGEAALASPQTTLSPPDFPVDVSFTAQEALDLDRDSFRALLLSRAADRIYADGASAFERDDSDPSFSSLEGAIWNGMNFLRERPHDVLRIVTLGAAATAAVLATALVGFGRGYGRLLALGVSVTLAAVPFLLLAVAARFALRLAADGLDDYVTDEFLSLAQELTWAPIRNGMIFSVGGVVLLVLGLVLTRWPVARPRLA